MSYFDDPKNVRNYTKMAEGYDGRELVRILSGHLKPGSSVLELGMGPEKDLDILKQQYKITGSDSSQVFLDAYQGSNPSANLLLLNTVTLETTQQFDCIYSNKVLLHLTPEELEKSVSNQVSRLCRGGQIFHSFWKGHGEESFHGLRFVYYQEQQLTTIFQKQFAVLEVASYTEMKKGDSIYLIARSKATS